MFLSCFSAEIFDFNGNFEGLNRFGVHILISIIINVAVRMVRRADFEYPKNGFLFLAL